MGRTLSCCRAIKSSSAREPALAAAARCRRETIPARDRPDRRRAVAAGRAKPRRTGRSAAALLRGLRLFPASPGIPPFCARCAARCGPGAWNVAASRLTTGNAPPLRRGRSAGGGVLRRGGGAACLHGLCHQSGSWRRRWRARSPTRFWTSGRTSAWRMRARCLNCRPQRFPHRDAAALARRLRRLPATARPLGADGRDVRPRRRGGAAGGLPCSTAPARLAAGGRRPRRRHARRFGPRHARARRGAGRATDPDPDLQQGVRRLWRRGGVPDRTAGQAGGRQWTVRRFDAAASPGGGGRGDSPWN
jgi:hypothetical protein